MENYPKNNFYLSKCKLKICLYHADLGVDLIIHTNKTMFVIPIKRRGSSKPLLVFSFVMRQQQQQSTHNKGKCNAIPHHIF